MVRAVFRRDCDHDSFFWESEDRDGLFDKGEGSGGGKIFDVEGSEEYDW